MVLRGHAVALLPQRKIRDQWFQGDERFYFFLNSRPDHSFRRVSDLVCDTTKRVAEVVIPRWASLGGYPAR